MKSHDPNRTPVKCVAVSSCGNFSIIGSATGWVDKFNIQSGEHRGTFSDPALDGYAHSMAISFLATDRIYNI
jgi:U3 small nucleolar RNA-associated protein 21